MIPLLASGPPATGLQAPHPAADAAADLGTCSWSGSVLIPRKQLMTRPSAQ